MTQQYIDLIPGARQYKSATYSAGPKIREREQFKVKTELVAGVIEPTQSKWPAPILLSPKKDGKLRFCINYHKLNALTVKNPYPLQLKDE